MTNSDLYFNAARAWATADGHARKLEAMKEPELAKRAKELGAELSVAAAEREVKASPEWHQYIAAMVEARTLANTEKAEMETLLMKHEEAMGRSRVQAA